MKKVITVDSTNVEDLEVLYNTYYETKRELENRQGLKISFKFEIVVETV